MSCLNSQHPFWVLVPVALTQRSEKVNFEILLCLHNLVLWQICINKGNYVPRSHLLNVHLPYY